MFVRNLKRISSTKCETVEEFIKIECRNGKGEIDLNLSVYFASNPSEERQAICEHAICFLHPPKKAGYVILIGEYKNQNIAHFDRIQTYFSFINERHYELKFHNVDELREYIDVWFPNLQAQSRGLKKADFQNIITHLIEKSSWKVEWNTALQNIKAANSWEKLLK